MSRLIGNLLIWQKFALIGVLALAMLAAPTCRSIDHALETMRVARAEAGGMQPAGNMLRLIQLTQQHRGLTAGLLGGNETFREQRAEKQRQADDALSQALQSAATLGNAKLNTRADKLRSDWQSLAGAVAARAIAPLESFARHTALVAEQIELLEAVTDVSMLAVDPDMASSHLIVGTLTHLPRVTEALAQARARGTLVLSKGETTPVERVLIAGLADAVRSHSSSVRRALGKAAEADAALARTLEKPIAEADAAAERGIGIIDEHIVAAEKLALAPAEYFGTMTQVIDAQFDLVTVAFKTLNRILDDRVAEKQRILVTVIASLLLPGALAIWIVVVITRTTSQSLREAMEAADALADGDLTRQVHARTGDEVGQLMRSIGTGMATLACAVHSVKQSSESVSAAAVQIAQGNLDLSARTEEQASNLQQTAASLEQLTANVSQSSDNARQANRVASGASAVAIEGGQVVSRVIGTMGEIERASHKMADIVNVIDGIAFQTNILALNAAVEAARAGEQGRGFAVVAAEVRSLAQRSAQAAREVKTLITDSIKRVDAGSKLVNDAGQTMNAIVAQVKHVTDLIAEITTASTEQNSGITQINDAVTQLDQATQQNAALVEESAAAAESLKDQAVKLNAAVSVFRTGASVAEPAVEPPTADFELFQARCGGC